MIDENVLFCKFIENVLKLQTGKNKNEATWEEMIAAIYTAEIYWPQAKAHYLATKKELQDDAEKEAELEETHPSQPKCSEDSEDEFLKYKKT